MKKYNLQYLKRNAFYCFGIGFPLSFLFLIAALFSEYDLSVSFYPLLVSFVIWCLLTIPILWSNNLLRFQIKTLNVAFNDNNAYKIAPSSLTYLSDNWLIASGKLVLYKYFIKSISVRSQIKNNSMGGYYCIIKCNNGKKYGLFVPSVREYKTINRCITHRQDSACAKVT